MSFEQIVDEAIDILRRRRRVAYRTLKLQLSLDDDALEALKDELVYAQRVASDEEGRVLVWCGDPVPVPGADAPPETPPREAERRHLTVVFCDLVESTSLAGQLDPEDLREVIRAYQAACTEVVQRFEGHIAQYLGDGLLVYFGYPGAHEDDAQRAIRAGLEMVEAVHALNSRLQREKAVRLAVRVGIHTGLVVIGEVGAGGRHEQLAMGEAPNVAARVQGLARPDTVLISGATWRLAQGYFVCRDLGVHALKGVGTAVSLYEVVGDSGAQSRLDASSPRGLTPLVGRESEIALLLECWRQASDGLGRVVVLSGEAGIGKSRLVQVLKDRLAGESHVAWECRASPFNQHSALHPIIELFQRVLRWQREDTAEDKLDTLARELQASRLPLAETVPLLAALLSLPLSEGRYVPLALTPQRQKQRTLEIILTLLLERAEQGPVLVIVEDLHWVDPSTLEFLALLLDHAPTTRLMVLLTCRPEFQPSWGSRAYLVPIALQRLPRPQVEEMVERVTGGRPLPPAVMRQVLARTDGVPLFVEELVKTIQESGWLDEPAPGPASAGSLAPLAIPATLHDALMARLDRLGSAAKTVAQLGATMGRTFAHDLLLAVAALDETVLHSCLVQLIDAELLYPRGVPPQATYTFKHALIQEAAYLSLLRSTRHQYHRRIADVLETRFGDVAATQPELLATHLTEAGLAGRAVQYWQQAGERAIERSAHVEAISHLTRGLAGLETLPDSTARARQELDVLSSLGLALVATKGQAHKDVESVYVRARGLSLRLGESGHRVLAGLHSVYVVRGELAAGREVAEELYDLAQRQHDPVLRVSAHCFLGQGAVLRGQLTEGRAHLERCIELADSQPSHTPAFPSLFPADLGVFSRCFAGHALWQLGYPDQSLRVNDEAVALAAERAHPYSLALALAYAAMLHVFRRDARMVQETADRAAALCREQGYAYYLAWATIMQGWVLAVQGPGNVGMANMREGLAAMHATGAALRKPYYLGLLAEACGKAGRADEGLALLSEALAVADRTGEGWSVAELHRQQGELLLAVGRGVDEAEESFRQALAVAGHQQAKSLELRAAVSLARLWQGQGKPGPARDLLAPIHGWFTEGAQTVDRLEAAALLRSLATDGD